MPGSLSYLLSTYIDTLNDCLSYEKTTLPLETSEILTTIVDTVDDSAHHQFLQWLEATHKNVQICIQQEEWDALEELIESAEAVHLSLIKEEKNASPHSQSPGIH